MTVPHPHWQAVLDVPGQGGEQDADRGGAGNGNHQQPVQPSDNEEADLAFALKHTNIMMEIDHIYNTDCDIIAHETGYEIGLRIAVEKAFDTAVCPEDSPRGWKEIMNRPDHARWIEAAEMK